MIDVAVVGAGLAGLSCAARLATAGFEVVVFEEHAKIGVPTHCTGIVSPDVLEFVKIPETAILNRLTVAHLVSPTGWRVEIPWNHEGREEILVVDRRIVDAELERAAAQAGARICLDAKVESVRVHARCAEVAIRGAAPVRARACVIAAGVGYCLGRRLGLGLPAGVLHSAQMEVSAVAADAVELRFGRAVAPDGFLWLVPVTRPEGPALKVGVMARGNAAEALSRALSEPEIRDRLSAAPPPPVLRLLPLGPVPRTYDDRLLLIGDAAGLVKPTTGGGIYYGLLSAALAAEVLAARLRSDDLDRSAMAAYEGRWRARLGRELRLGAWARAVWSRLGDAELDLLIRAVGSEDVLALLRRAARFNWHSRLIVSLLRQPGIGVLVARSLLR